MQLLHGDCLDLMKDIPDNSIDLILCDLPYETTASKWDKLIPFDKLWEQYKRIIKNNAAIVLFGAEPFTSKLILSNLDMFKYNWYWNKNSSAGFVNAKLKPMNTIETISIFSKGKTSNGNKNNMKYYPQGLKPYNKMSRKGNTPDQDNTYYRPSTTDAYLQQWTNYPKNYLQFNKQQKAVHPCQKPLDLLEYLINTYSKENETVLDNCMGSGSCGVAAVNTNRNFIGIEKDDKYFEIAKNRIEQAQKDKESMLFSEVV